MTQKLKTALLQVDLKWEDPQANRSLFTKEIEALSDDVDLVVLPEMFTTGFSMNAKELAEEMDGLSLQWMREMAIQKASAITGSLIIKEAGKYYNRLFFVFPDGHFQVYDKRHSFTLAREDRTYTAGTKRLVVEYMGWKICPLICYDLRFPIWSRNTVDFDLLIYVANWPERRIAAWDTLLKARAIENMCYCLGVNRVGIDENGHGYIGHSALYDGLGNQLTGAYLEEPQVECLELDKEKLRSIRDHLGFLRDRDDFQILI